MKAKPIIALMDPERSKGGLTKAEVHAQLLEADASYAKWGFDGDGGEPGGELDRAGGARVPAALATAAAVLRSDLTKVTVVVRDLIRAATVDDRVHNAREPAVPPQPEDGVTDGKLRGVRCADRDPRLPATGRTR